MKNEHLLSLLNEIYQFGLLNDKANPDKAARMRNVTPLTGKLLGFLIETAGSTRVLEIGTSNGYSTLWIADALTTNQGVVTTLEYDVHKAELAAANFAKSGLQKRIRLEVVDAGSFLKSQDAHAYDFIFMDSERVQYVAWWADIQRVLVPGGTIVVDNTVSHAEEMATFISTVESTPNVQHIHLPIEQGILLIRKDK